MPRPSNPQTGLVDEELPLEDELENYQEPAVEEPEDTDADEVVDEPVEEPQDDDQPAPLFGNGDEDHIPKSRFDAEKARADTLQHVLEMLQQGGQPQRQQQRTAPMEDPDANLDPKDKEWRKYIRQAAAPEIQRFVSEAIEDIKQNHIDPLRRTTIEVQDRTAENLVRAKYRDYDRLRDLINRQRAEWFQQYKIVAPHEVAYHYVRSISGLKQNPATRTQAVRQNAKQGAQVANRPPAKKVQPKGPVTLNDVASMSPEDAERWLARNNFKF